MDNLFLNFEKKHTIELDHSPEWTKRNAVSLLAYKAVISKSEKIEQRIKKTPHSLISKLRVVEKQIVIADIAKEIGCSRSALSKNRRPELHEFIDRVNIKLASLLKIHTDSKVNGRQLRRDELQAKCEQLQNDYNAMARFKIGRVVSEVFESKVVEHHRLLAAKLDSTQQQLEEFKEKSFNQSIKIHSLIEQLDLVNTQKEEALKELEGLKAKVRLLTQKNDQF